MKRKRPVDDGTSLFDNLEEDEPSLQEQIAQAERELAALTAPAKPTWSEVPEVIFKQWPVKKQLSYCAARDEHSASECEGVEQQFYLNRAAAYREAVKNYGE